MPCHAGSSAACPRFGSSTSNANVIANGFMSIAPILFFVRYGKRECDGGAAADLAGDFAPAAVKSCNRFHECESQADRSTAGSPRRVHPVEAVEYVRKVLRRNACSRVRNFNPYFIPP